MKKNKFYILLSILTIVFLFSFSAVCNQCTAANEEEKTDIVEEEEVTEDEPVEAEAEDDSAEDNMEEELPEETEKPGEEKAAPTIKLEIHQNATLETSVCYWRIRAVVTGEPTPVIEWNKDDSLGFFGDEIAQVNLNDPSETFTLNATAKNSKGEASDSIELSWECEQSAVPGGSGEEENNDPEISTMDVNTSESKFYINGECTLETNVSDPDGDSLSYQWEVTGGSITDPNSQNTTWTMPSTPGSYTVTLTVSDGKGGEDTESKDKNVTDLVYDFLEEAPNADWKNIGSDIDFDDLSNPSRGFAKYDYNTVLEDGNTYTKVLETHPEWRDYGWILGAFPNLNDLINIPSGAKFKAKVGFLDDLGSTVTTDGITFIIQFLEVGGTAYYFPNVQGLHCDYDQALDTLNIDLNSIAGKTGSFHLNVFAGPTSWDDHAVWVDPKIVIE
jgi:hypothetical protein